MSDSPLHLFEGFGVELEYMIVDARSLDVSPLTDRVMHAIAGEYVSDVEHDDIAWSNELALHVIELKTNGPASELESLPAKFQQNITHIQSLLDPLGAKLLPSAMHPWMDPQKEMRLWPHEYSPVYEAFDRIFDCRGHGWANLQSVHLNLPFADDAEFGRLHAAVRLILPLLPALAASSPIVDGRTTGKMDSRLNAYRYNARRIPSVTGLVIPEPAYTQQDYDREIFQRMYADIAPFDPDGTLQHEFLNARGAIARFDRNTIEIRVLDVQECPQADLAICAAVIAVLRLLIDETWTPLSSQQRFDTQRLSNILTATIDAADQAVIANEEYLQQLGWKRSSATARELWRHLIDAAGLLSNNAFDGWKQPLRTILEHGPLARRILARLNGNESRDALTSVYRELADCLLQGKVFQPAQ